MRLTHLFFAALVSLPAGAAELATNSGPDPFRLLATNKTKTTESEINEAARSGYRFVDMMAGETLGGDEVVTVMYLDPSVEPGVQRFEYKLLATNKTSTMQKEITAVGRQGYRYAGQSVAETSFGGQEVLVIVEHALDQPDRQYEYRLLATTRTKTMGRELNEARRQGFELMGMTVSTTMFGGQELVSILMRQVD